MKIDKRGKYDGTYFFQVFEAERMVTRVGNFHRNCFSCIECNKKLDSTTVCEGEKINVQTIFFPSGTQQHGTEEILSFYLPLYH